MPRPDRDRGREVPDSARVGLLRLSYSMSAREGWGDRFGLALDDHQTIGDLSLCAVTGAIANLTLVPESGGTATVKVHGFLAAQSDQESGQFVETHSGREISLAAVHFDEEEAILVPPDCGPGVPLEHRTEFVAF
jgi:hypothetical protein